jgi:hypothetical protein
MDFSFVTMLAENTVGPVDLQAQYIRELWTNLVDKLFPGAFVWMLVLITLTLIATIWVVFNQRKLATNQVKIAELVAEHLAEHVAHEAAHARYDAEHGKA